MRRIRRFWHSLLLALFVPCETVAPPYVPQESEKPPA